MKTTFKIRKGTGRSAKIQLFFNYGLNKRLRYSTRLSVLDMKNWDAKNMKIRNVIAEVYRHDVNDDLNDSKALIESFYNKKIKNKEDVDNKILKEELDIFFNRSKNIATEESSYLDLLPFYNWYIENYQKNPLVTTGRTMSKGTAKTYRNAYTILKRFNDNHLTLTYEKINLEFYDSFLDFMREEDYSINYIGTQIKILKTIMNSSYEKGYHNILDYKKRGFKKPSESIFNIYLNPYELQKIYDLDFSEFVPKRINKNFVITVDKLENSRNLFLISANTGLRVSDFNSLTPKNIISNGGSSYISLITQKNPKGLTIPINSMVRSILSKNNGKPPKKMVDQHINYCLKEIGLLAKIIDPIEKEITRGGKIVIQIFKKNELITNHTGRRSFCTNAYKSGMPTIDIMTISGHSTEKVFYNYIKVDDLERAEKIAKHKFFSDTK